MASPQIEDGFTRIANEILEALAAHRLSGQERQILDVVFRKTYGFNKKEDEISMGQFSNLTGISRPNVAAVLRQLLSKNILGVKQNHNSGLNSYQFQKDFTKWKILPKRGGVKQNHNSGVMENHNDLLSKTITGVLSKTIHTKESLKDTSKESLKDIPALFEIFWKSYPKRKSRADAEKAFKKISPNEQLLSVMLTAISLATTSEDWTKEKGKYIPYPASWLNGRRWEDEQTEAAPSLQPVSKFVQGPMAWLKEQEAKDAAEG